MKRRTYVGLIAGLGIAGAGGYLASRDSSPRDSPGDRPEAPSATPAGTPTPKPTQTPEPTRTQTPEPTPTSTSFEPTTKTHGAVSLTVANPTLEPALTIEGETRRPADGNAFLLLRLVAENVGDRNPSDGGPPEAENVPSPLSYLADGTEYEITGSGGPDSPERIDSPRKPLYSDGGAIWPGATREGWIFGEVPRESRQVTFAWRYRGPQADERTLEWQIPVPE